MKYRKKRAAGLLAIMTACSILCGCKGNLDNKKVVLTTGFEKDEIFRIEEVSCSKAEIMVYLTNMQNRYESVYGREILDTQIDGVTLEENVKETALANMAQVKAMTLLANRHGVVLTDEEMELVKTAAKEYYNSLNEKEISLMCVNEDIIVSLYSEFALANKLYHFLIKDINPEISDDEARTITVEHILIKTYNVDENGNVEEYSTYSKQLAREKAQEVLKRARSGEDFHVLAGEYSEDKSLTYSFGKGEMEAGFEEAAFNLGNDEISDIVETKHGYHIIKCISTFNREVTDENKKKIVEQRREEVFGEEYENFVLSLTKNLNKELWETVSFIHDEEVVTDDFFEVYNSYFEDYQIP